MRKPVLVSAEALNMRLENPAMCNSHILAQCRIDTGPKGHKSGLQKQEITAFSWREFGGGLAWGEGY